MRNLTPVTEQCVDEQPSTERVTFEQQVAGLTDQQLLKEYEIRIQFLDLGCIVNVGCKAVAFNNTYEAIEIVKEYILNPKEVMKHWRKKFNMDL